MNESSLLRIRSTRNTYGCPIGGVATRGRWKVVIARKQKWRLTEARFFRVIKRLYKWSQVRIGNVDGALDSRCSLHNVITALITCVYATTRLSLTSLVRTSLSIFRSRLLGFLNATRECVTLWKVVEYSILRTMFSLFFFFLFLK